MTSSNKQLLIWLAAIFIGAVAGLLHAGWIDASANFVATVYTRLFQFLAVPTVALAITTTLISFGRQGSTRKISLHTLVYTTLTPLAAALVGMFLYLIIRPGNKAAIISPTAFLSCPALIFDLPGDGGEYKNFCRENGYVFLLEEF